MPRRPAVQTAPPVADPFGERLATALPGLPELKRDLAAMDGERAIASLDRLDDLRAAGTRRPAVTDG